MSHHVASTLALPAVLTLVGCGDTGQELVTLPIAARGDGEHVTTIGAWTVTLARAEVSLGPVTFCATAAADADLCEDAVAEWRGADTVDALDPGAQPLGTVSGVSGAVRSATLDYGVSWPLTWEAPRAVQGVQRSLSLEASAERGRDALRLVAQLDIAPRGAGMATVIALPARHELGASTRGVHLTLRPTEWVAQLDLDALFAIARGPDTLEVVAGTDAHDALVFALTSSAPPEIDWQEGSE